ncbi:MAG: hypothetical protein LUE11_01385, partial [Clostridia bacterium]|nr:hypothetical protein [Clostridia bacterium]
EEDEFEEDDEAEEAGVTHVYEPEEETAEESGDLWEEADEAIQDSETDIDMLEQLPEEDSVAADFKETLEREEEIEAKEAKLTMPQPRPEDTPVISEEELAEFLSDVDEEEEEKEHVSFEQLLRDNGVALEEDKPKQPKISLEEFPEEETMVYVDIPIREPSPEEADKPHQPELFDAEAEMEKESETPDEEPEEPAGVSEEEQEEPIPESDPDWLNVPLEELCKTAPALEQLRQEGPVMAREVLRQKEWIMERFRRYQDEERRAQMPEEELDEEPETEPQKPEDEPEELDAIHAADELHALLEQEENENDSVFHDGPTGKPETEAAGQKESIIEVTVAVPEAEEPAELEEELAEREEQPAEQPKQKSERPKPDREKASWPQEAVPEDLNKESKRYRIRAGKQARRASVIAVLTLICIYISCAADFAILPLPDSMNYAYHPSNVLTAFLVLMGISILLAYDVIWEGVQALIHLRPNMSTLIDLALALNVIHCVIRLISEGEEIPYACIAMLSLFAQMRAQVSKSTIRHYTYKVAGNARQPMGLFYHGGPQPHIVKAPLENTDVFIAQTLQRGKRQRDETIFTMMSAIVALVLSVIVCTATGDTGRLIYVLAATVTGACQIALICAMVMARSHTARRMLRGGTAADDNIGIERLAKTQTIVLTDEDLFPANSIALERLELRSNLNDSTALAYAAALTGGSSLGSMLAEEVRTRYGAPLMARHVVHDVHGGVSGQIGGLQVMLGDDRYMAEHGVITSDVPENGLILALDGNVAAVMVIDYQVPAALFNAMQVLTEKKTTIWLHTRNHQVTPKLVEQKYALKEGTVIVPEMETDRALSSPHYTDKDLLCGLVMRDGFVPMSGCITAARVEARISPAGIIIGACVSLLCVLLMTYLCYVFVPSDAHPIRVLIYMILCFIPIFFLENGIDKE